MQPQSFIDAILQVLEVFDFIVFKVIKVAFTLSDVVELREELGPGGRVAREVEKDRAARVGGGVCRKGR